MHLLIGKTTTLTALLFMTLISRGVESENRLKGLELSAEATLRVDTNQPRIFLTLHLLNTSDRELTVLTKNLNLSVEPAADHLILSIGYGDKPVTHHGHPIIPSLCDFSPVTLRPNEEAFVQREVLNGLEVLAQRNDMPLVVVYSISPEWGARFVVWSGTVRSGPITPAVRKGR